MFQGPMPDDTSLRLHRHLATSLFLTLCTDPDLMWAALRHLLQSSRGAEGGERRLEASVSGGPGHVCFGHFGNLTHTYSMNFLFTPYAARIPWTVT